MKMTRSRSPKLAPKIKDQHQNNQYPGRVESMPTGVHERLKLEISPGVCSADVFNTIRHLQEMAI